MIGDLIMRGDAAKVPVPKLRTAYTHLKAYEKQRGLNYMSRRVERLAKPVEYSFARCHGQLSARSTPSPVRLKLSEMGEIMGEGGDLFLAERISNIGHRRSAPPDRVPDLYSCNALTRYSSRWPAIRATALVPA